ncbi:hypothetical protein SUDANB21_02081 [Streptomyces sp. enrichment culture]|uniref:hypothetical protein n=1 Tax=Streptomyces sp. enrichment culture TaxID=1795815 RepID=UPI003F5521E1
MTNRDEVALGDDWPSTYAMVPDWITLHPNLKAQSIRAYAFLAMHAPTDGRRRIAFPGQASIARALQMSRADKVIPYLRALEHVGAIRTEEIATPKGRANRYVLRFNPPPGYTGPTSLSDFYGGERTDNNSPWSGWSAATAPARTPPQGYTRKEGYPQEGVDPSTRNEGEGSTRKGGSKKTNKNQTQGEPDDAPSARSAGGVRSTSSSGSSARGGGGSAATEQQASPSKPPKLSAPQRKAVLAVESVLPPVLLAALPYGHIPNRNRPAVLAALESRTVGQLAERVRRRWVSYGYEAAFHSGEISSLVGAALELLAPTPYCPDLSCEDGWMVDTGEQCRACVQRRADRRAARARGETPAGGTGADRPECVDCGRPFPGAVPDDGLCRSCAVTPTAAMEALLARWAAEDASARQVEDLYAEADRRRKQRAADRPTTSQHGNAPF